jgi:hypothetical protein
MFNKVLLVILSSFLYYSTKAQVAGGASIFTFLQNAQSARITGNGGSIISAPIADISAVWTNPALLKPNMSGQLGINQNMFFGAQYSNVNYAYNANKLKTSFAGGVSYINHGKINATTTNGNIINDINIVEMALQLSASRQYNNNWRYGSTLKFVNSAIGSDNANGLMADFGLHYADTNKLFYFGMVAKNIGFQIGKYNFQTKSQAMPFDMQIGLSKKFAKAPFRLNLLLHHLYEWDMHYDNPADRNLNLLFDNEDTAYSKNYIETAFRHVNVSVDLLLGKRLELTVGYNHQRRGELALTDRKGLAGFSLGVGVNLPKFTVYYGRSIHNFTNAYNHIGINMKMKELF